MTIIGATYFLITLIFILFFAASIFLRFQLKDSKWQNLIVSIGNFFAAGFLIWVFVYFQHETIEKWSFNKLNEYDKGLYTSLKLSLSLMQFLYPTIFIAVALDNFNSFYKTLAKK